ncbi:MFS transporter [Citricoccus sp. NR2]|uniref:MFS transporter n=1 Tax=Citricoccus sp. NR2 TaxID=3004095 RepID=UPI0022DE01DA|nr:MFS transporter [Citricoccus sp. NR2]WBL17909.1 MFS transporter [Citricoccus sp. NR2]
MDSSQPTSPRVPLSAGLAVVAVVAIAINLRAAATSIGPLLEEITESAGFTPTGSGLLTALPGLCFAVMGLLAVRFAVRVGLSRGLAWAMTALVLGLAVRPWMPSPWLFVAVSGVALAGIAVGNVLVPAWIKRHGGLNTVRLMTIYSSLLVLGGSLGALVSAPLAVSVSQSFAASGWQSSLVFWALVAVVPLVIWWLVSARTGHDFPRGAVADAPTLPLYRSRTAWALTVLFGFQSMNAYVQFGWLPQVYRDAGIPAVQSGTLVAVLSGMGVIGGVVMPTVIARARGLWVWLVLFGVFTTVGYLGLLVAADTLPWLWAVVLGLGGFAFPTAIALIPARSRDPRVTARLSGFVQPIGYFVAAAGPFGVGLIHAATPDWTLVLVLLACSGVVMSVAGLLVARPRAVDDELSVS